MFKRALLVCSIVISAAVPLHSAELERILLPVASHAFQGAYGSFWVTRFTIVNDLDRSLVQGEDAGPFGDCFFPPCEPLPPIPANTAFDPVLPRPNLDWKPGLLIYVARDIADRLYFSLRVQDTSRQSLTWGTEIPVVRERDFRTGKIILPNVPIDSRFRQSLRVYDVDESTATCNRVMVRLFNQQSGATLGTRELELTAPNGGPCGPTSFLPYPDAAELHGIAQLLTGSAPDVVGVEITPLTPFRYWAFISVTNNETQHVTTITPQ